MEIIVDNSPTNIVEIEFFRKRPPASCNHYGSFEICNESETVFCADCQEVVNPFLAIKRIAFKDGMYTKRRNRLVEEVRELTNWNPFLRAVRALHDVWRGKMLPCCYHCGAGLEVEKLASFGRLVSKKYHQRIDSIHVVTDENSLPK